MTGGGETAPDTLTPQGNCNGAAAAHLNWGLANYSIRQSSVPAVGDNVPSHASFPPTERQMQLSNSKETDEIFWKFKTKIMHHPCPYSSETEISHPPCVLVNVLTKKTITSTPNQTLQTSATAERT